MESKDSKSYIDDLIEKVELVLQKENEDIDGITSISFSEQLLREYCEDFGVPVSLIILFEPKKIKNDYTKDEYESIIVQYLGYILTGNER